MKNQPAPEERGPPGSGWHKKRAFRLLFHIDPWVSGGTAEGDFHEGFTAEVAEGFPAEDLAVFGVVDVVGVFNEHFCIHIVFSFLVCFYN